jgi:hypothetical protein
MTAFGAKPQRGELAVSEVSLALEQGPEDPSLHDPEWRAFVLAREQNSEQSGRNWKRYRLGIRRLDYAFRGRVPIEQMKRALAEDVFICACWYQRSAGVVRAALGDLLTYRLGVSVYAHVTAEYWKWAKAHSPDDRPVAGKMVVQAQHALDRFDGWERQGLERMLASLVGENET